MNFKINNKVSYNIYYLAILWIIILNILMIIKPDLLVIFPSETINNGIYPEELLNTMAFLFNIPIAFIFIVPMVIDYSFSVWELGFLGNKNRYNSALVQKLKLSAIISCVLYLITIINGYILYKINVGVEISNFMFLRIVISTGVPFIFLICFSIFIITLMRGNSFSVFISLSYYLIIEKLFPLIKLFLYFDRNIEYSTILMTQIIHLIISITLLYLSSKNLKKINV